MTNMENPVVYTTDEAADILKTSPVVVRKMFKTKILPVIKVGREYRVSKADLEAFIKRKIK